jgi:carboxypeptidase family protein
MGPGPNVPILILGTVYDSHSGAPIHGATVTLSGYPPDDSTAMSTDASGNYVFQFQSEPEWPGTATLIASCPGYRTSTPYTLTNIVEFGFFQQNFSLNPVGALKGKLFDAPTKTAILGAKVSAGTLSNMSHGDGSYLLDPSQLSIRIVKRNDGLDVSG